MKGPRIFKVLSRVGKLIIKVKFSRISQYFLEFSKIFQDFLGFSRISLRVSRISKISSDISKSFLGFLRFSRISQNFLRFSRISQNFSLATLICTLLLRFILPSENVSVCFRHIFRRFQTETRKIPLLCPVLKSTPLVPSFPLVCLILQQTIVQTVPVQKIVYQNLKLGHYRHLVYESYSVLRETPFLLQVQVQPGIVLHIVYQVIDNATVYFVSTLSRVAKLKNLGNSRKSWECLVWIL